MVVAMKQGITGRTMEARAHLGAAIAGLFARHAQVHTKANARVFIRSCPSADSHPITSVARDQPLKLTGRDSLGIWLQVDTLDGNTGWISSVFVSTSVSIQQLPVAWTAPQRISRHITAGLQPRRRAAIQ